MTTPLLPAWVVILLIKPYRPFAPAIAVAGPGRGQRGMATHPDERGLRCAPKAGPSIVTSANRIAPVASVLPSSATATFPPADRSAMIPDPTTVANRIRLPSANSYLGCRQ